MSPGNTPALSYHAQQCRVRLELTRAIALSSPWPPPDLIKRARAKLESVKKEGKISFFNIYEDKLLEVWKALREANDQPPSVTVAITLGAGAPAIEGLLVVGSPPPNAGVLITCEKPIDIKTVQREWVRATILNAAVESKIQGGLFLPQLQSAVVRLFSGEKLDKFSVSAAGATPEVSLEGKLFSVLANKSRGEIVLFVRDVMAVQNEQAIENICNAVRAAIEKLKAGGISRMRFLKSDMISCIKAGVTGPERVGSGVPLAVLAAIPVDMTSIAGAKLPAKKYLNIRASEDKMSAAIIVFEMRHYSDPAFKLSKDFMEEQLQLNGIKFGFNDDILADMEDAFSKRANLNTKVVAHGKPAVVGAEPYLHFVYKDSPLATEADGPINIRDAQQRTIVHKDQFFGEVRYAKPAETGTTVLGRSIAPADGPPLTISVGDGVEEREPGKFYASSDGVPQLEENNLKIAKMLVHEGDVNLKSGNIYFDGPVEIKGSVEAGSVVRVRGPLKIHGSIIGAFVSSKEPIEVVESIVTGETGKVICASHVKADFIENSNIECDGTLTVNRSLVTSNVVAGAFIRAIAADGVVGGGKVVCRGMVLSANIGFAKGARTNFVVGVDNKIMRRIGIREKRLESLKTSQERYKSEFRELAQKRENQLTAKHRKQKEVIKKKMTQIRPMLEKAAILVEEVKASMTYNSEALIAATNVFAANCTIEIGGQGFVMELDMIAAAVTARVVRDTHLLTFDEVKSEVERKLGEAPSADASGEAESKKAS